MISGLVGRQRRVEQMLAGFARKAQHESGRNFPAEAEIAGGNVAAEIEAPGPPGRFIQDFSRAHAVQHQ